MKKLFTIHIKLMVAMFLLAVLIPQLAGMFFIFTFAIAIHYLFFG